MRLFHVSEESSIGVFYPRLPLRKDLDPTIGLVWAITEECLPNFLTPRDCPRVTYHVWDATTEGDRRRLFSSPSALHCVAIEAGWLDRLRSTTLYLYEFDPAGFTLQDEAAGYYVATTPQTPVAVHRVDDLLDELVRRRVEVRIVDNLHDLADEVRNSSMAFSLCRMRNAAPRA